MRIFETRKFHRLRKKIREGEERKALKEAIIKINEKPFTGKKLKGEFKDLRSYRYFARGQERRLIYKYEKGNLYLISFGPREGIYS